MATIEWVNHAGYVLEHGRVRLICDPWIEGPAFDFGWDLLSKTKFSYDEFKNLTHLWFSHEHPDHFSIPSLKLVPAEAKANLEVLYQESIDKKLPQFCRKLGFEHLTEMKPGTWLRLDDEVEILCQPHDNGDSWLAVRLPGLIFLNINDCVIFSARQCEEILKLVGHVDVLATQFSYANWVANKGDLAAMRAVTEEKLQWLKTQVVTLKPAYVIPFASFVHFSHQDNQHLNEGMNRITQVVDFIRRETPASPVVLYPGDRWALCEPSADLTRHAAERYEADFDQVLANGFKHPSLHVPLEKVIEHGNAFVQRLRAKNGPQVHLLLPAKIFVEDLNCALILSPRGVHVTDSSAQNCDIQCKSAAIDYCFIHEWGGRTLDINGRFQLPARGSYWKFKAYTVLSDFNNRGQGFGAILSTIGQRLLNNLRK